MVAMLASRVALSCEPMKRSTLSSSIRRTADFAVSAGGPPASVKINRTGRPMIPPALLIFSAARSAQARCVGPKSEAGPLSAMKKPILNSFGCANAERTKPADEASTVVPAAAVRMRRRAGMKSWLMVVSSLVDLRSRLRRRHLGQHRLDCARNRQQARVAGFGPVELDAERQARTRHRRRQADARDPC